MAETMTMQMSFLGQAGEHYVMSQLLARGMLASMAPAGMAEADIIVTDQTSGRSCMLQVKCRQHSDKGSGWRMHARHETIVRSTLFYCFVDNLVSETLKPVTYVVPSAVVAEVIAKSHQVYLAKPGRGGKQRIGSEMRNFYTDFDAAGMVFGCGDGWLDRFRENWTPLLRDFSL